MIQEEILDEDNLSRIGWVFSFWMTQESDSDGEIANPKVRMKAIQTASRPNGRPSEKPDLDPGRRRRLPF